MKTWVWLLFSALCGYVVYSTWFKDAEETQSEPETPVLEEPQPAPPPVAAEPDPPPAVHPRRLDIDGSAPAPASVVVREHPEARRLDAERQAALAKGEQAKADALGRKILASHPDSDAARWIRFERGKAAFAKYRAVGLNKEGLKHAVVAWRELTPALFLSDPNAGSKDVLLETLRKLSKDILFRGRHVEGVDHLYTPQSGDNLDTLRRKKFKALGATASPHFIAEINGLKGPQALRAGETIRVPLGDPEIVVSKREFRLYFLIGGGYVADFPIGLGREGSTPAASFVINEKVPEPDWWVNGRKIPYGHPENILGTRWMAFKNSAEYVGFGIHGTADPTSIGKEESSGCIRMHRADVEKLFDWTPIGARVRILP